jgi:hypothetical protein
MLKKHEVGSTSGFLCSSYYLLLDVWKRERIFFTLQTMFDLHLYKQQPWNSGNQFLSTYIHTNNNNNNCNTTPPPPYHQQATHPTTLGRHQGKPLGLPHWRFLCDWARHTTYAPSSMETHYNFSCEWITKWVLMSTLVTYPVNPVASPSH